MQVICPILVNLFGTPSNAAVYLQKCLRGEVQRTNRGGAEDGVPSCSSYEEVIEQLFKGQTTLLNCGFQKEVRQFVRIAMKGGAKLDKPLRDLIFGNTHNNFPLSYCPLLWLETYQETYLTTYQDEWDYASYVSLWETLLWDGKMMKGNYDGDYSIPDLGALVDLKGQTFEQHSKAVAERHAGGDVLLLSSYRDGGSWCFWDTEGRVDKDQHYYDMVVPLIGGVPQWHEWSFAPFFGACKVVPVSKFVSGEYEDSLEVAEPPIRGKFLARAKGAAYKAGKKIKLAA